MLYGHIYLIKDHWTNKVYIGRRKGHESETPNYYGSGTKIRQIIKKRPHHLEKRILGYCDTLEELIEAETECIYFYRAFGSDGENLDFVYGYNLRPTGETGGWDTVNKHPNYENIKQKGINARKQSFPKRREEFCRKQKEVHATKEYKEKMSQSINNPLVKAKIKKTKIENKSHAGSRNAMYGLSMKQRLVNKHGHKEGQIKYQQWKNKKKEQNKGKNNPRYYEIEPNIQKQIVNDYVVNGVDIKFLHEKYLFGAAKIVSTLKKNGVNIRKANEQVRLNNQNKLQLPVEYL